VRPDDGVDLAENSPPTNLDWFISRFGKLYGRQYIKQDTQLSQRNRAAGGLVMAKNGRLELGYHTLRTLEVYLQAL